jgi:acetate kinase
MPPSPASALRSASGATVLALNGGSSSLRFALHRVDTAATRILSGKIERIGLPDAVLQLRQPEKEPERSRVCAPDHLSGVSLVLDAMEQHAGSDRWAAAGHRVVHGGPSYSQPQRITADLLHELHRLSPFDPEHLPSEIQIIERLQQRHPDLPQVACFDTAFHRDMPPVARLLPIPRRFAAKGVVRYGFHGLSYESVMAGLARSGGADATCGRIILAHLGNGVSLAAVRDGQGIDTTMALTPAAGMPMSTRCGDIDPGLAWFLNRTEHIDPEQFHRMINEESGLLGLSEISPDMRDLLRHEATDTRAAEAVSLFCYQLKKWIGAFAAALGGLDTLVFTGGIGENAAPIRQRACDGLKFLGIEIDPQSNHASAPVVSTRSSRVTVRVIRTDEEEIIARATIRVLHLGEQKGT